MELHIFPISENETKICSCFPWEEATESALYREYIFSRYNAVLSRIQYILSHIAIGLIFYAYPYSVLIRNIGTTYAYIFNITFHVIQLISIQIFLKISLGDPGIIKKKHSSNTETNDSTPLTSNYRRNYKHSFEPIEIDPDHAPTSFCWRCLFVRPVRAKHDYDIDACVAVFDHYSPVIGNAIGAYNHKYFVLLKALDIIVYVLCIYIMIDLLIFSIVYRYSNILGWILILLTGIYILYMLKDPVLILVYHIYLAITNQTTYELIKPHANLNTVQLLQEFRADRRHRHIRVEDANSFDEGFVGNLILFLNGYEKKVEYFYGFESEVRDMDYSDHDDYHFGNTAEEEFLSRIQLALQ
eukprot:440233_1